MLFTEIISRMPVSSYRLIGFRPNPPDAFVRGSWSFFPARALERYRRAPSPGAFDIFHSTYYRLPQARGAKIVTTVYDFTYERFASPLRRAAHHWQKQRAIAGADRIICISESTRHDLLEYVGTAYEDRSVVVPLAASETFQPLASDEPLPQVLFVGGRAGYKNFAAVVNALMTLPDLSLLCVGGGPFTASERHLLERQVPGRYSHAGQISADELNREYNRSLCLAYVSLHEGFGIPVLEAMQAGCPVVAMNSSSIPEVAGDAAVLMERGTADEIRAGIARLTDRAQRDCYVARGRDRAAMFSWNESCRRTVAVYDDLASTS